MEPQAEHTINTVLAVDPGRDKCGLAVVTKEIGVPICFKVLHKEVAATSGILEIIERLSAAHNPDVIIIGNGTTSAKLEFQVRALQRAAVEIVDEKFTTLLAKELYFKDNPPRGVKRLIPTSLQSPDKPYDDYVAILLAERYLATSGKECGL